MTNNLVKINLCALYEEQEESLFPYAQINMHTENGQPAKPEMSDNIVLSG